jgi:ribosomal protein S18 acetylase RimI-like enzyme
MSPGFLCRALGAADAPLLAAMLSSQSQDYTRYFRPFPFDEAAIHGFLSAARQDMYFGVFWDEALVAFFMLRGWDKGYDVPAYGVVVDDEHRGMGLGRLTLEMSKTICRLRGAERLMLKVHPENVAAKHLYESAGFVQTGIDPRNDNLIYHFSFES